MNHICDKGLIGKIYKEHLQIKSKLITWLKNGQSTRIHISPKKTYEWQKVYEKVLKITNHQGNANQHLNELLDPTCCNGHLSKKNQITEVAEVMKKKEPFLVFAVGGDIN